MDLSKVDELIVHYDTYKRYSEETGEFPYCHELFSKFERVNIITLRASEKALVGRQKARLYKKLRLYFKGLFKSDEASSSKITLPQVLWLWKKLKRYKQGISHRLDNKWLTHLKQHSVENNWVIDSSAPYADMTGPKGVVTRREK